MEDTATDELTDRIRRSALSLFNYCRKHDWVGFDPYDALNSRVFAYTPFSRSRACRIALTQALKRLPVNLRSFLLISQGQNPKALALFLGSCLRLSRLGLIGQGEAVETLVERLVALRSKGTSYWCWGYNFPWQTRTVMVPSAAPNLVCTTFVANSLLDAYEQTREPRYLNMASSAAEYLLNELYWTEGKDVAGFAYPLPSSRSRVHNANFLGAALLCRAYCHSGEKRFLEPALKAARYSASRQGPDGSWSYGELPTQRWIDNFHTGYNLCALRAIGQYAKTMEFETHLTRGFDFYRKDFFSDGCVPKYFHDRVYPVDIHSVAQSIITLLTLKDLDNDSTGLAQSVFVWAMDNMYCDAGYFYYQMHALYKNKISYMRWSQAWMLMAISTLLGYCEEISTG